MPFCKKCEDWYFNHTESGRDCFCKKHYFQHENWGDEWQEIYAKYSDDAAEKFAKLFNEDGDYALMDDEVDVKIKDPAGKIVTYTVRAEPSINYYVNEK